MKLKLIFGIPTLLLLGLCWMHTAMALHQASLEKIEVSSIEGDRILLRLGLSAPMMAPKSFAIENPPRLCFDFEGVKNGLSKEVSRSEFNVGVLKKILVKESENKTRVIVDLAESVPFEVKMQGNEALIILSGSIPSNQSMVKETSAKVFEAKGINNANSYFAINKIDFRRTLHDVGQIIIDLNEASMPIDLKEEGDVIRVRFIGAQLPPQLQRKLDVTDFGTPVTTINTTQQGNDVVMLIQTVGISENMAFQANRQFTIEVRSLTKEEKAKIEAQTFKYTGERLSLNFQDVEVRAVLQLIADFTGLNIITSDTVTGNLTLRLKNVPWDQALDIILKTKGLAKRQVGNVLMIGPTEEMAAKEKLELQSIQQVADLEPLHAEYIQVNFAKASDLAALLKTEKNSMLSSRGTVSVDERTNTLLVQDTTRKLEEVHAVVHRLDIPVRQVLIESRIVFATDNFQDIIGISLGTASKFRPGKEPVLGVAGFVQGLGGTGSSSIALGNPPNPASVGVIDRLATDMLHTLPLEGSSTILSQIGMTIAKLPGGTILDMELQALESEGLGKIVASPRLITSNQQLAYIESGEEIPYQEATSSGAASIAFKKAVLRLEVIPQITPNDHVIMDLKVNQDSRGVETAGVPAINTRQMHTKVLVANGETVVLGGIYQQEKQCQIDKIPFLYKLPLIGWMFQNKNYLDKRTELMIFVTPKIIQDGMA